MKTIRTLAWTALAGLAVIGPMAISGLGDSAAGGSSSDTTITTPSGGTVFYDLTALGFTVDALDEAVVVMACEAFCIKMLPGASDYIVLTTPDDQAATLVKFTIGRGVKVADMRRVRRFSGRAVVEITPVDRTRPDARVGIALPKDGMDPQAVVNALDAGAILFASGTGL